MTSNIENPLSHESTHNLTQQREREREKARERERERDAQTDIKTCRDTRNVRMYVAGGWGAQLGAQNTWTHVRTQG